MTVSLPIALLLLMSCVLSEAAMEDHIETELCLLYHIHSPRFCFALNMHADISRPDAPNSSLEPWPDSGAIGS
jgi:hypothetical protein